MEPRQLLQQVKIAKIVLYDILLRSFSYDYVAGIMKNMSGRFYVDPIRFVADHPFLFAIIDRETKNIFFLGRVMEFSNLAIENVKC